MKIAFVVGRSVFVENPFSYYFSFLKNGLRIAQQEESGGLVFGVVQRLPNGIIRPE
jgi:hypothetical protein